MVSQHIWHGNDMPLTHQQICLCAICQDLTLNVPSISAIDQREEISGVGDKPAHDAAVLLGRPYPIRRRMHAHLRTRLGSSTIATRPCSFAVLRADPT